MNQVGQTILIVLFILGIAAFFALRFLKTKVAQLKRDVVEMIKNPGKALTKGATAAIAGKIKPGGLKGF